MKIAKDNSNKDKKKRLLLRDSKASDYLNFSPFLCFSCCFSSSSLIEWLNRPKKLHFELLSNYCVNLSATASSTEMMKVEDPADLRYWISPFISFTNFRLISRLIPSSVASPVLSNI